MKLLLHNCTIWDAKHADPLEDADVLIEDGRIAVIGSKNGRALHRARDALSLDLEGRFLLPGLWDAHAHLGMALPQTDLSKRPPLDQPVQRSIRAGKNAQAALRAGVTSIRVVGEAYCVDIAWKRAFASGEWLGPTLYVCGAALAATGGHATHSGLATEVDGPEGFRWGVREQLKQGADQIKLMLTGGIGGSAEETPETVELEADEVRAAVETAHRRGVIVGAHIGGTAGVKLAVEAGVDVVEHGYILDEEAVALMARHGTFFVPTLSVTQRSDDEYREANWAEYAIQNAAKIRQRHAHSFQLALEAGVRIAVGEDTDSIATNVVGEMELMAARSMPTHQVLTAATLVPAEICRVQDSRGTIEVGKWADLIVVEGNPVDDLSVLRSPVVVLKEGQIAVNNLIPGSSNFFGGENAYLS